jgi:membrane-associated phospholipid phosphatase
MAAGALAGGALLDKPVDRFMKKHQDSSAARAWGNVGKAIPVVLTGAAGAAVLFGDARMENIGIISLESVAGAAALSMGTKRLIGRSRPSEERGGSCTCATSRSDSSFPSNHSAVAFAAVTPFAQEYDAPWLYGLAAVSTMGRVASREHWVSDVVGGGVIGYAVGNWLWKSQRTNSGSQFAIAPGRNEISVAWSGTY